MSGWMVVCVSSSACVHPYLYVYKHEWMLAHVLSAFVFVCVNICTNDYVCIQFIFTHFGCLRMCYLRLCLYVWLYVRMTVCVHTIHIYTFRLYSGAVFHGYGTFILRSTDGYLALCGIKCDINRTLCFQHLVLVRVSWCNLNRQQCKSHRCCLPSLSHSPLLPHQSVCFWPRYSKLNL